MVRFQLRGEPKSGTTWAAFIVQLLFTTTCDYAGQCCVVSGSAMSRAGLLVNFSACSAAERARVAHDASLAGPGPPPAALWLSTFAKHEFDVDLADRATPTACSGVCPAEASLALFAPCKQILAAAGEPRDGPLAGCTISDLLALCAHCTCTLRFFLFR